MTNENELVTLVLTKEEFKGMAYLLGEHETYGPSRVLKTDRSCSLCAKDLSINCAECWKAALLNANKDPK